MATPAPGTFLIPWTQAELDGLTGTPPGNLYVGATWRWTGQAIRIDDPRDIFVLQAGQGIADTHRRAARRLSRFLGEADQLTTQKDNPEIEQPLFRYGFELTDGCAKFQATLVQTENGQYPMLIFIGSMPPVDQDLWVVSCSLPGVSMPVSPPARGTVCFTPATRITTPEGQKTVRDLCEGDLICTKDNGPQAIRWIGSRNITGGRLMAIRDLRPIRLQAHVLADGEPDQDLLISPDHRILVKGPVAQALFNTPEVLVAARDLVNDRSIRVDQRCRGVCYIHLMLAQHEIVWANGVEVESFHPAGMDCDNIDPRQRDSLWEQFPDAREDTANYGEFARRKLTRSEAALLSHGAD